MANEHIKYDVIKFYPLKLYEYFAHALKMGGLYNILHTILYKFV